MAFRIEDCIVRGEIDNRVKGTVRGKFWLEGSTKAGILSNLSVMVELSVKLATNTKATAWLKIEPRLLILMLATP